jgi:hypothetical protein
MHLDVSEPRFGKHFRIHLECGCRGRRRTELSSYQEPSLSALRGGMHSATLYPDPHVLVTFRWDVEGKLCVVMGEVNDLARVPRLDRSVRAAGESPHATTLGLALLRRICRPKRRPRREAIRY